MWSRWSATSRAPRARCRGDRLQHGLDAGAAAAARPPRAADRRHGAGDQAGGRARRARGLVSVLATSGTIRRDYTRDLIREFAGRLRGEAGRLGAAGAAGRGAYARRAGGRCGDRGRDRAGLCRGDGRAHRCRRAGLHPLSVPGRRFRAAGAVAGRPGSTRRRRSRAGRRSVLGARSRGGAGRRAGTADLGQAWPAALRAGVWRRSAFGAPV